jgi:hypothetical protein
MRRRIPAIERPGPLPLLAIPDHPTPINEEREAVVILVASEIHNEEKVIEDEGGAHHPRAVES